MPTYQQLKTLLSSRALDDAFAPDSRPALFAAPETGGLRIEIGARVRC